MNPYQKLADKDLHCWGMGVHFKCMMSCQVGTFTELFILNVKCGVTGVAWACYAPNFEKVQGAYCFGLVRLCVCSKLIKARVFRFYD